MGSGKPVVFVTGGDPRAGWGGAASYVRAHGRAARHAGYTPHIFCAGRESGVVEADFGIIHRVRVPWRLDQAPWFRFRRHLMVWHIPLLIRAVRSFVLGQGDRSLIHGFSVFGYVGVAVSRSLRHRGVEAVPIASAYDTLAHEAQAEVRGLRPLHGALQRLSHEAQLLLTRLTLSPLERRGYAGSRLVLVNYESVRRRLSQSYGLGEKILKLPYSSESAFVRQKFPLEPPRTIAALEPRGAPLVLSVSRHDPRKGLDVLLHALARLREKGVRFRACLVGTGPLLPAHRRLADRLEVGQLILFAGFVPDLSPYFAHADLFALPSHEEGSGSLSLLEGMQAGIAIVASNVDGIPEDVIDGESALLVQPGNASELTRALEQLLTDSGLRKNLAQGARRTFTARFSADVFAGALGKTYAGLGFLLQPARRAKT